MTLSPEQEAKVVEGARQELVKALITNHGNRVYLSKYEVCGLLNWSPQTVMGRLTPIDTTENGGSVRFLLSEIEEVMESRKTKGGSK